MNDIKKLSDTIVPKSDQLNADDLIVGPIDVSITGVRRGESKEQPINLDIDGGRMPYRPCKSMRRVLIALWGDDGHVWIGRRLRLYSDPSVMYGGVKVGGIRISHASHIDGKRSMMLTTTRSKRAEYVVHPMPSESHAGLAEKIVTDNLLVISEATTVEELKIAYGNAYKLAQEAQDNDAGARFAVAKDKRKTELAKQEEKPQK